MYSFSSGWHFSTGGRNGSSPLRPPSASAKGTDKEAVKAVLSFLGSPTNASVVGGPLRQHTCGLRRNRNGVRKESQLLYPCKRTSFGAAPGLATFRMRTSVRQCSERFSCKTNRATYIFLDTTLSQRFESVH